jgi:hypothetical protein
MSRQYRNEQPQLSGSLAALERAAEHAFAAAQDAYPPGARCVVRSQRYGHAVVERVALIVRTSAELSMSTTGQPWASVTVLTKNLKTGKSRAFYPSVEVAGQPSIRVEGMTLREHDFINAMKSGIPPIAPPVDHRCECDPTNHHVCDDCEAASHALRQYAPNQEQSHG